jgi:hypothetical protein
MNKAEKEAKLQLFEFAILFEFFKNKMFEKVLF